MEYTKDRAVLSLEDELLQKFIGNYCHSGSDTP